MERGSGAEKGRAGLRGGAAPRSLLAALLLAALLLASASAPARAGDDIGVASAPRYTVAGLRFAPGDLHNGPGDFLTRTPPGRVTHVLESAAGGKSARIGFNRHGGGYINFFSLQGYPGYQGGANVAIPGYGRGWQGSIRDQMHGGNWNPTHAGYAYDIGTPTDVKLASSSFIVPQYQIATFKNGLSLKDTIATEFDFSTRTDDVSALYGLPAFDHVEYYIWAREPDGIRQHPVVPSRRVADVSPTLPGNQTPSDTDMSNLIDTKMGIRLTGQFRWLHYRSGGRWQRRRAAEAGWSGINCYFDGRGDCSLDLPLLILSDHRSPHQGTGVALYTPDDELNVRQIRVIDRQTLRELYREDRRTNSYMTQEHRDGFFSVRSRDYLTGMFAPGSASRHNGRPVFEALVTHSVFLVGTPVEILRAIERAGKDRQAPSASVDSPAPGERVSGTVRIEASASDDSAVASLRLELDGRALGPALATAPYAASWDTSAVADGTHTLTAVAVDEAGNVGTSPGVLVRVDNAPRPASACARAEAAGGLVDTRQFGAAGDARRDDGPALQAAMDCARSLLDKGLAVSYRLPPGTYATRSAIELAQGTSTWRALSIQGDGVFTTVLRADAPTGLFKLAFRTQLPVEVQDLTMVAAVPEAGAAIRVEMPPAPASPARSLVLRDLQVLGLEASTDRHFTHGVDGRGLNEPLIDNVTFRGPGRGPLGVGFGGACAQLRRGRGVRVTGGSMCTGFARGLDVEQDGGDVHVDSVQFGVNSDVALRVRAGGGSVRSSAHVNTMRWSHDISGASAVDLSHSLTLNLDAAPREGTGGTRVQDSSAVTIANNIFWRTSENPLRRTVLIGANSAGVRVADNVFNEGGAGIVVSSGTPAARLLYNRFPAASPRIVDHGAGTLILRLPEEGR